MSADPSIAAGLAELGHAVAEARAQVAAGQIVKLDDFGASLQSLCREIEAAGIAEGRHHIDTLTALRDDLEQLAEEIAGQVSQLAALPPDTAGEPDQTTPS